MALANRCALVGAVSITATLAVSSARAQSTIRNPNDRPDTTLELEPHFVLGAFDPPGPGPGSDAGFGGGVRASFEVARNGFIGKLNDSVAVGVGLDVLEYDGHPRGYCERFEPGPNSTQICTRVSGSGSSVYYLVPVVMQWNFWLTRRWSVFGEPGFLFRYVNDDFGFNPFVLYGGGRLHFSDSIALTLRVGYPTFSLGVSFLF